MSNDRARAALLADLRNPASRVRQRAALTLRTAPDVALEEALVNGVVCEPDPFVRDTLTAALVVCSDAVVPRLVARLGDPDADVRQHAAHVLGKRADAGATDALLRAAADEHPVVVSKAVFALGRIRDPRSIATLVVALAHAADLVRQAAREALQSFGADAVAALVAALTNGHAEQRRQIAYALAASRSVSGVAALRELLADPDAAVRFAALHGLMMADSAAAATAAAAMLEDPESKVRALATRCLREQ
jgi:HEAT repeat protein